MKTELTLPMSLKSDYRIYLILIPAVLIVALTSVGIILIGIKVNSVLTLCIGCALIAIIVIALNCVITELVLYDHGFILKSKLTTTEIKWSDICMLTPITFLGMSFTIGWFYKEEYKKSKMGKIARAFSCESMADRTMHGLYRGYSTIELANLMSRILIMAKPAPPISLEQKFALATSAILTEVNGHRHDILQGDLPNYSLTATARDVLSSSWGVSTGIELNQCLSWLKRDGDRKNYEELVAHLSDIGTFSDPLQLLKPEAVAKMSRKEKDNFKREALCAQKYMSQHKSILAWDLCRLVSVSRFGAAANYLTDDEAWQWILDAASTLRNVFSSWQKMADNYLVGREFAAIGLGDTEVSIAVKKLLDKENSLSPWNTIPWNATPKTYGIEFDVSTLSHFGDVDAFGASPDN